MEAGRWAGRKGGKEREGDGGSDAHCEAEPGARRMGRGRLPAARALAAAAWPSAPRSALNLPKNAISTLAKAAQLRQTDALHTTHHPSPTAGSTVCHTEPLRPLGPSAPARAGWVDGWLPLTGEVIMARMIG